MPRIIMSVCLYMHFYNNKVKIGWFSLNNAWILTIKYSKESFSNIEFDYAIGFTKIYAFKFES